jgi:hypothetical protein
MISLPNMFLSEGELNSGLSNERLSQLIPYIPLKENCELRIETVPIFIDQFFSNSVSNAIEFLYSPLVSLSNPIRPPSAPLTSRGWTAFHPPE